MEDSPEQQDQVEMEGSFVQRDNDKLVFARIHSPIQISTKKISIKQFMVMMQ